MERKLLAIGEQINIVYQDLQDASQKYGDRSQIVDNLSGQLNDLEKEHSALLKEIEGKQEW